MVLFWYIFIPKMEHFLPGVGTKISILTAGHFWFQKSPLYNIYNKSSVYSLYLFNMHNFLSFQNSFVAKLRFQNATRRKMPFPVANILPQFHCALYTVKRHKYTRLLCYFSNPKNCKHSEEKCSNIKKLTYSKRAASPLPYLCKPVGYLKLKAMRK